MANITPDYRDGEELIHDHLRHDYNELDDELKSLVYSAYLQGIEEGYAEGHSVGYEEGREEGNMNGYEEGYDDARAEFDDEW